MSRTEDFSGGPVVKNPPRNIGDAGLVPGWGPKIPHAEQLSPPASDETCPQILEDIILPCFRFHSELLYLVLP